LGKPWPALQIHLPGCDPQLEELVLAELDDFQPTAISEEGHPSALRAFFESAQSRDAAARALASAFGTHLYVESISVDDQDWAARSQAQLTAVTIGCLVVAPPWDWSSGSDPRTGRGSEVGAPRRVTVRGSDPMIARVVIQPSMGFGTGHHATTRLALMALQNLPLDGRSALDIGCGSGVLAIAAVGLGARSATGIDIDPDALENARENAALNEMGDRVTFEQGDFREISRRADIVMANLTGGLLERSAAKLAGTVEPGGALIISGFMESEKDVVVPALQSRLELRAIEQEEEWMCAVFRRSDNGRSG
jgi:ribosomal protein L11 methylase PrmA